MRISRCTLVKFVRCEWFSGPQTHMKFLYGRIIILEIWEFPTAVEQWNRSLSHALCFPGNSRRQFLKLDSFIFIYMWIGTLQCVCLVPMQTPRCPESEVTDGCEISCSYWELNTGPQEEQHVLLTTHPSLQLWAIIW